MIDNEYFVGMAHGFQPMGDHDDRLFVSQFADGFHQLLFVFGVDIGGGFIQNDDGRVFQHGPGDGEPLAFAAGEGSSRLADDGVVALGQFQNEIVAAGLFRRRNHLIHGRVRLPEANVIGDGIVEQIYVLEHEAEILHQAVHIVIAHVAAAQGHPAAVHIPKPGKQVAQGGLAAPRGAHDGRSGLFGNFQGHAVDNGPAFIGKAHLLGPQIVPQGSDFLPGNVHGGQIEDIAGLIYAGIHHPQQAGLGARLLQSLRQKERTYSQHDAIEQIHAPADVQRQRQRHHRHVD